MAKLPNKIEPNSRTEKRFIETEVGESKYGLNNNIISRQLHQFAAVVRLKDKKGFVHEVEI